MWLCVEGGEWGVAVSFFLSFSLFVFVYMCVYISGKKERGASAGHGGRGGGFWFCGFPGFIGVRLFPVGESRMRRVYRRDGKRGGKGGMGEGGRSFFV